MLAAEFPNDNPDLHEGTIWVCLEVTGAPVAERHLRALPVAIAPVVLEPVIEADVHPVIATLAEPILPSTVEVLDVEPPPARESGIFMTFSSLKEEEEEEILVEELGPLEDAILEAAVEPLVAIAPVVETIIEAFVEPEPLTETTIAPPPPDDAWVMFVGTLVEIAIAQGAAAAAGDLPASLDGDAIALAWAGILRGTSEDWDAVGGSMLDEWAAETLARITGADTQVLKRELRARGVAAFGLAA